MSDVTCYYDGTKTVVKLQDKVYWEYDESPIEGTLEALGAESFNVDWPDEGVIEYPIYKIAALCPSK